MFPMLTLIRALPLILFQTIMIGCCDAASFIPSTALPRSHPRTFASNHQYYLHSTRTNPTIELDQYDFSSQAGWDAFYNQFEDTNPDDDDHADDDEHSIPRNDKETFEFEWHSSMSHQNVIEEIPKSSKVILVGNGNSRLPREIYDFYNGDVDVTCLDYSQPCVNMMEMLHAKDCPGMKFVCGDVTDMYQVLCSTPMSMAAEEDSCNNEIVSNTTRHSDNKNSMNTFDVLVDKGLMDAMMCMDGWDGKVKNYWIEARKVLKSQGKIILIAYKLSSGTREFLHEIGLELGIEWIEQESKSNGRVTFLIGSCC